MKRSLVILMLVGTLSLQVKQIPERIFIEDFVECYYPNSLEEPLYIYDNYQGRVIDTLYNGTKYQWYKLAIRESKGENWFCLEHLLHGPSGKACDYPEYEGAWVCSKALILHSYEMLLDHSQFNIYTEPNESSEVTFVVREFIMPRLIATDQDWAKVEFETEGVLKTGWMAREDQCGIPWTTCAGYGYEGN